MLPRPKISLKILHISTYDNNGGAARAAYRIHQAQVLVGIDSRMRVLTKCTDDERVTGGVSQSIAERLLANFHRRVLDLRRKGWTTDNPVIHTFGEESADLVDELNASDADILNLHWVAGMLSIADIRRLRKPLVWTLHDMWAFCGGEHYAPDDSQARFRRGYRLDNRPSGERGPDLNRRTWAKKQTAWAQQRFSLVSPSQWLADCAQNSVIFSDTVIHVIPYYLNMQFPWRPIARDFARNALGLPQSSKLILMGAMGGMSDPRKGGDLLNDSIARLAACNGGLDIALVVYGQSAPITENAYPCPVYWLGAVQDDRVLALAYAAVNLMVVPSRQDNLPNTALEAQACGTPVVAFDVGGLPDIVLHKSTGWLAPAFDTNDMAHGIGWLLADDARLQVVSNEARVQALARFGADAVGQKYRNVYEGVLSTEGDRFYEQ